MVSRKQGVPLAPRFLDVLRLDALRGIWDDGATLAIGALTNYRELRTHPLVRTYVPLLARAGTSRRKGASPRITLDELVDAGEAMLLEMVRLTRAARRDR